MSKWLIFWELGEILLREKESSPVKRISNIEITNFLNFLNMIGNVEVTNSLIFFTIN